MNMNRIIKNALFTSILIVLSVTIAACQGMKEPKVIAKDRLEVLTGGSITGWPTGFKVLEGSATISAGNTYYIYFDCWNNAVGSELVLVSICKEG